MTADRLFKSLTKGIVFAKKQEEEKQATVEALTGLPDSLDTPDEVSKFRRQLDIRVYGESDRNMIPAPLLQIGHLSTIPRSLSERVQTLFPKGLTPVQRQAIPLLMENRDVFVVAPTGSGKTMSYLIPLLARILDSKEDEGEVEGKKRKRSSKSKEGDKNKEETSKVPSPRAVIVAPTRELASQIHGEARRLETGVKVSLLNKALIRSWESKPPSSIAPVLVCSPMRLVQALEKGLIAMKGLEMVILDEADKLLELGFLEQVDRILVDAPVGCVKTLFSATIPTGVERIAQSFMVHPLRLVVGVTNAACANVKQSLVYCGQEAGRLMALRQMLLLQQYEGQAIEVPCLIFCETQMRVTQLYQQLLELKVPHLDYFHADRVDRMSVVEGLRSGRLWFVVCTDLLARGLDFPSIHTVINYDFPTSCATYIHRCGRTGRAGRPGNAYTLFTDANVPDLPTIANVMMQSGQSVPDWMWNARSKRDKQRQRFIQQAKRIKNNSQ